VGAVVDAGAGDGVHARAGTDVGMELDLLLE
jgi:hypothetical protein